MGSCPSERLQRDGEKVGLWGEQGEGEKCVRRERDNPGVGDKGFCLTLTEKTRAGIPKGKQQRRDTMDAGRGSPQDGPQTSPDGLTRPTELKELQPTLRASKGETSPHKVCRQQWGTAETLRNGEG